MDKKKDEKNMHAGHRARLTEALFETGLDRASQVQAVEYFLTTIIPRVDVNPLAHELIQKYGSFHNIIDASVDDLSDVKGLSEVTAKRIKLFGQLMDLYVVSKLDKKINIQNYGMFLDFLEELMRFKMVEFFYFFAISNKYNIISVRRIDMNDVREVGITPEFVYKFVASTKPTYVIIAHNHPGGTARASATDVSGTARIKGLVEDLGCRFYDSFVVGEDGIFSAEQNGFVRHYTDLKG